MAQVWSCYTAVEKALSDTAPINWSSQFCPEVSLAFGPSVSSQGSEGYDCLFSITMTVYIAASLHYLETVSSIRRLKNLTQWSMGQLRSEKSVYSL